VFAWSQHLYDHVQGACVGWLGQAPYCSVPGLQHLGVYINYPLSLSITWRPLPLGLGCIPMNVICDFLLTVWLDHSQVLSQLDKLGGGHLGVRVIICQATLKEGENNKQARNNK
jgi:hypothetical protein